MILASVNNTAALLRVPVGWHLARCQFIIAREAVVISDVMAPAAAAAAAAARLAAVYS